MTIAFSPSNSAFDTGGRTGATTPFDGVFPQPVVLTIADQTVQISEYTLEDIAILQAWLRSQVPCPVDEIPDQPTKAEVVAAWGALEHWPPTPFDSHGQALLATKQGRLVQLVTSLCRANPSLEGVASLAVELLPQMTNPQWRTFDRIAWAVTPWRALVRYLTRDPLANGRGSEVEPDNEDVKPFDPGLVIAWLVEQYHWTPAQAGGLYLSQWRLLSRRTLPAFDGDHGTPGAPDRYYGLAKLADESRRDWLKRSGGLLTVD